MPTTIPNLDPMPLPAPVWLLHALLLVTFFLHVVFMNCAAGGLVIAVVSAIRGRKHALAQQLSRELARKLPVLLAFTITLGVAPLLFLQTLFGQFFYSSSVLLGAAWMLVIPVLIVGYYGVYFFSLRDESKPARPGILAALLALACVLTVGFVNTNNFTLMLTPTKWLGMYSADPSGWNLNLGDYSVLPRYLHMMLGAIAVAGLLPLVAGVRKRGTEYGEWLMKQGALWFTIPTVANFFVGMWFLVALPPPVKMMFMGQNVLATALLAVGFFLPIAAVAHVVMAGGGRKPMRQAAVGIGSALATVAVMVGMRDLARQTYLADYIQLSQLPAAPNWGVIALFLVTFVAGLATLGWMVRKMFIRTAQPEAAAAAAAAK